MSWHIYLLTNLAAGTAAATEAVEAVANVGGVVVEDADILPIGRKSLFGLPRRSAAAVADDSVKWDRPPRPLPLTLPIPRSLSNNDDDVV